LAIPVRSFQQRQESAHVGRLAEVGLFSKADIDRRGRSTIMGGRRTLEFA